MDEVDALRAFFECYETFLMPSYSLIHPQVEYDELIFSPRVRHGALPAVGEPFDMHTEMGQSDSSRPSFARVTAQPRVTA